MDEPDPMVICQRRDDLFKSSGQCLFPTFNVIYHPVIIFLSVWTLVFLHLADQFIFSFFAVLDTKLNHSHENPLNNLLEKLMNNLEISNLMPIENCEKKKGLHGFSLICLPVASECVQPTDWTLVSLSGRDGW